MRARLFLFVLALSALALSMVVSGCTMFSSPDDFTSSKASGQDTTSPPSDTSTPPDATSQPDQIGPWDTILPDGPCVEFCTAYTVMCPITFPEGDCLGWCRGLPITNPDDPFANTLECHISQLESDAACMDAGPESLVCGGGVGPTCIDIDGDGFPGQPGCGQPVDCDDGNIDVGPGFEEVCDGLDNNCDGTVDELGCGDCVEGSRCACGVDENDVMNVTEGLWMEESRACIDTCADPSIPTEPCFQECIEQMGILTPECSACVGTFEACRADYCFNECVNDPWSAECVDCSYGNTSGVDCVYELVQCGGLQPPI